MRLVFFKNGHCSYDRGKRNGVLIPEGVVPYHISGPMCYNAQFMTFKLPFFLAFSQHVNCIDVNSHYD